VKVRVSENCTDGNYAEVDHSICNVVLTGFAVHAKLFEGKQALGVLHRTYIAILSWC
jgi:hypothetical protein